jgi:hypothetical protein
MFNYVASGVLVIIIASMLIILRKVEQRRKRSGEPLTETYPPGVDRAPAPRDPGPPQGT